MPRISVIMSVYNTPEEYLRQAIESVLGQTFGDFEFIIIDDCSTYPISDIVLSYNDSRIMLIRNEQNLGLTVSLNKALSIAKGQYIARIDGDDISHLDRFEKQIKWFEENPNCIVCGTWGNYFGDKQGLAITPFVDRESFRILMMFGNYPGILHVAAMLNKALMDKYNIKYDENYRYAQDYKLWVTCSQVAPLGGIEEPLVDIRVRPGSISTGKKKEQDQCAIRIMQDQLDLLHLKLNEDHFDLHCGLLNQRKEFDHRIKAWMKEIERANKKYQCYDQKVMHELFTERWAKICYWELKKKHNLKEIVTVITTLSPKQIIKIIGYIRNKRKKVFNKAITNSMGE